MDGSDYPQEEGRAPASKVPSLIHDYRAQRDAWREQARNLARMREEVLTAADQEAHGIVATARAEIRAILLKARRDLLVLAAQVRAAGRLGDAEDGPDVSFLPADDLSTANTSLSSARRDIKQLLDDSRPELEGLVSEGEALRAALRQQRPPGPTPIDRHRQIPAVPVQPVPVRSFADQTVDFEFTTIAAEEPTDFAIRKRWPARTLIAAVATLGGIALMGTTWWLYRPTGAAGGATPVESTASAVAPASAAAKSPAPTAAKNPAPTTARNPVTTAAKSPATNVTGTAPVRTAAENGFRGSPIPASRAPLTISLSARRAAWIRVTADGRITAERTFKPGETQQISASRDISIRAGDAGAVTVSVDGRAPVTLGAEGSVVTRRFEVEKPRVQPALPSRPQMAPPNPQVPVASVTPPPSPSSTASTAPRVTTPQPVATQSTPVALPPPTASTLTSPKPAATSADRAVTPAAPAPTTTQPSLQDSLTSTASRWLDAYYRQDRATMASISPQVSVTDDRGDKDRLPRNMVGVRRMLEDVNLQIVGSEAILTARMTERMDDGAAGRMAQAVSFVAHMWTQRNGTWQLHDVRIVSAASLGQSLR